MLNLTEQRILVALSIEAVNKDVEYLDPINIPNKELCKITQKSDVYIGLVVAKLQADGYISINGKRGKGRLITVLKPQLEIK